MSNKTLPHVSVVSVLQNNSVDKLTAFEQNCSHNSKESIKQLTIDVSQVLSWTPGLVLRLHGKHSELQLFTKREDKSIGERVMVSVNSALKKSLRTPLPNVPNLIIL